MFGMNPLYLAAVLVISVVYVWTLYNLPILLVGIRSLRREKKRGKPVLGDGDLPFVSVIVPVKNECRVVGRLLEALDGLDYPEDKREFVVVEGGSTDGSLEICREFSRGHGGFRVVCDGGGGGKPAALMEALKFVKGEVVGVFDADSVPEGDVLLRVAEHFSGGGVDALQGRQCAINGGENMLTRFVAEEEKVRYDGLIRGKEELGLFVPLNGSCYFVRREALEGVGGWDQDALSEDMDLAARLVGEGYRIRYGGDVRCLQEYPSGLGEFVRQRVRWFRGTMEAGLKYGRLLRSPSLLVLDAEVTMVGPFVYLSFLLGYLIPVLALFVPFRFDFVSLLFANFTCVLSVVLLGLAGAVMVFASRPRSLRSVLWLPFIYLYWLVQNFVSLYALLQIVFRRPRCWSKTEKTGKVVG
jgi:cellulose synthase/poly-beta-1,6-N-acetylglucosamine synthase-like glycosyltransferase